MGTWSLFSSKSRKPYQKFSMPRYVFRRTAFKPMATGNHDCAPNKKTFAHPNRGGTKVPRGKWPGAPAAGATAIN